MIAERTPNRWLMLTVSMAGQIAGTVFISAAPFLIPLLHLDRGLSLIHAGLIASAPLIGTTMTLILWGAVVDRIGERRSMAYGMTLITVSAFAAAVTSHSYVALAAFLFLGGMGGASASSASGRIVVGWFPAQQRGLAMGIRQTAQPLGVGLAALIIPVTAKNLGLQTAILVPACLCLVALLVGLLIVDPPRPTRQEAADLGQLLNPYRRDDRLWRIHLSSMLLVIPQFTVWTYAVVWLISEKHWSALAAGALIAAVQLLGSAGRIAAGVWSDRAGSRLGPMRIVAVAAMGAMLALGLLEGTPLAISLMVVASVVTVADNGLAFTSVAEIGGPYWSGRALGTQNTGQFLTSAAVPPLIGAAITQHSYAFGFAIVALFPLIAIPLIPVKGEHPSS